jgi:hypothetical protein
MRKKLAAQEGVRKRFRAIFTRLGKKRSYTGYSEDTILLQHVCEADTMRTVADHVWFSYTKSFEAIKLTEGCVIEFDARVKAYTKGYVNKRFQVTPRTTDFKLSHPTRVTLIEG